MKNQVRNWRKFAIDPITINLVGFSFFSWFIHWNQLLFDCSFISVSSELLCFIDSDCHHLLSLSIIYINLYILRTWTPRYLLLLLCWFYSKLKINLKIFTEPKVFQILKIISMFDECSPVIIAEPFTMINRKLNNMIPVFKAGELHKIDSLTYFIKT